MKTTWRWLPENLWRHANQHLKSITLKKNQRKSMERVVSSQNQKTLMERLTYFKTSNSPLLNLTKDFTHSSLPQDNMGSSSMNFKKTRTKAPVSHPINYKKRSSQQDFCKCQFSEVFNKATRHNWGFKWIIFFFHLNRSQNALMKFPWKCVIALHFERCLKWSAITHFYGNLATNDRKREKW